MLGLTPIALMVIVAPVVAMLLLSLWRRRESIGRTVRVTILLEFIYLAVVLVLLKIGQPPTVAALAGLLVAVLILLRIPERKRRIPAAEKRKAIARFELKTGEKYSPRKHDIDHVIPFSSRGNNTADNLRVVDKRVNRAKGNQSPWWDLLGKR